MKAIYKVTNEKTFNDRVIEVDTEGLHPITGGFKGTIDIVFDNGERKTITGEHGKRDYVEEFGFEIVKQ